MYAPFDQIFYLKISMNKTEQFIRVKKSTRFKNRMLSL
jgi:hypothetical protein